MNDWQTDKWNINYLSIIQLISSGVHFIRIIDQLCSYILKMGEGGWHK